MTLGEKIDLGISGLPEIPDTEEEKADIAVIISSLTVEVLNSPNEALLIANMIENHAKQKTRQHVEHCLVPPDQSEINALQNGSSRTTDQTSNHDVPGVGQLVLKNTRRADAVVHPQKRRTQKSEGLYGFRAQA